MAGRRARIEDLLARQADDLGRLQDKEARRFLRAYEDARRDLRERLEALERTGADQVVRFTAQHLRVMLAQVEAGVARLQQRLGEVLDDNRRKQGERALADLVKTIARAEREFRDTGGRIEQRALQRLTEDRGLLLHEHSLRRYGAQLVEAIQRELVIGLTSGMTIRQMTDRIAGAEASVFAGHRARAELIARMELNAAFNGGHQAALEEAAAVLDRPGEPDPLLKRADEYWDARNHPFSRALDGRTALPAAEWEVPAAEVQAHAAQLGKRVTGIVWRLEGSTYKGFNYPAHYWDRGRQVPWRESWGEGEERGGSPARGRARPPKVESVEDPTVEKQVHGMACGPASAVMLARDRGVVLDQRVLAARLMTSEELRAKGLEMLGGMTAEDLAAMLSAAMPGSTWQGGGAVENEPSEIFAAFRRRGSWAALLGRGRVGHWVVVDGIAADGRVKVRDPSGHRRLFRMDEFLAEWYSRQVVVEARR